MITQQEILQTFNTGTSVSTSDQFLIETSLGQAMKVSAEWVRAYLTTGKSPDSESIDALVAQLSNLKVALEKKQDQLQSGVNIKTINGASLVGSGNVDIAEYDDTFIRSELASLATSTKKSLDSKQDSLQSGVNIKTINGDSILGEGNVELRDHLITLDEFHAIYPKLLKQYYVAKDKESKAKGKIWRVYLQNKPLYEFDDKGNVSVVFPRIFPILLA